MEAPKKVPLLMARPLRGGEGSKGRTIEEKDFFLLKLKKSKRIRWPLSTGGG